MNQIKLAPPYYPELKNGTKEEKQKQLEETPELAMTYNLYNVVCRLDALIMIMQNQTALLSKLAQSMDIKILGGNLKANG